MKTAIVILSTFLLVSCHTDNHSTYSLPSATQAIVPDGKMISDNGSVHQMLAAYNEKNWIGYC